MQERQEEEEEDMVVGCWGKLPPDLKSLTVGTNGVERSVQLNPKYIVTAAVCLSLIHI